jgi:hypothetical protein
LLGSAVDLLAAFLVDEGYGDVFCQAAKAEVAILDNRFGGVSEEDPIQVDDFRFSRLLCLGVLAGPGKPPMARSAVVAGAVSKRGEAGAPAPIAANKHRRNFGVFSKGRSRARSVGRRFVLPCW